MAGLSKVGIFYWKPGQEPPIVPAGGGTLTRVGTPGGSGWIRCQLAKSTDLVEALDEAVLLPGESVMNTHYLAIGHRPGRGGY